MTNPENNTRCALLIERQQATGVVDLLPSRSVFFRQGRRPDEWGRFLQKPPSIASKVEQAKKTDADGYQPSADGQTRDTVRTHS